MATTGRQRRFSAYSKMGQWTELTKENTSLTVEVYDGDEKLGELGIGRGSVTWVGLGQWKRARKRLTWQQLSELFQ